MVQCDHPLVVALTHPTRFVDNPPHDVGNIKALPWRCGLLVVLPVTRSALSVGEGERVLCLANVGD